MSAVEVADQPLPLASVTDAERLAVLERTGLLHGAGDPTLDRLARVASALVRAPHSYVSLVAADRQFLAGAAQSDEVTVAQRTEPLSASLCQFAVATGEPLVIQDVREDQLVRGTERGRTGDLGAYAGIPLRTSTGHVLGTLCVANEHPRQWSDDELQVLADLTAIAAREVEQRVQLAREARLRRAAQAVVRSVGSLSDAVTSLADLADQQDDSRLQRYSALSRLRVSNTAALAQELRDALGEQQGSASCPDATVDLRQTVRRAARSVAAASGSEVFRVALPDTALTVRCDAVALERAVTHLLITALHHKSGEAPVDVTLRAALGEGDVGEIIVRSGGSRIPTGELARLVARFHQATCDGADQDDEPARIRTMRGGVVAESGTVRGRSTNDGLEFSARWRLAQGAGTAAGAGLEQRTVVLPDAASPEARGRHARRQ